MLIEPRKLCVVALVRAQLHFVRQVHATEVATRRLLGCALRLVVHDDALGEVHGVLLRLDLHLVALVDVVLLARVRCLRQLDLGHVLMTRRGPLRAHNCRVDEAAAGRRSLRRARHRPVHTEGKRSDFGRRLGHHRHRMPILPALHTNNALLAHISILLAVHLLVTVAVAIKVLRRLLHLLLWQQAAVFLEHHAAGEVGPRVRHAGCRRHLVVAAQILNGFHVLARAEVEVGLSVAIVEVVHEGHLAVDRVVVDRGVLGARLLAVHAQRLHAGLFGRMDRPAELAQLALRVRRHLDFLDLRVDRVILNALLELAGRLLVHERSVLRRRYVVRAGARLRVGSLLTNLLVR